MHTRTHTHVQSNAGSNVCQHPQQLVRRNIRPARPVCARSQLAHCNHHEPKTSNLSLLNNACMHLHHGDVHPGLGDRSSGPASGCPYYRSCMCSVCHCLSNAPMGSCMHGSAHSALGLSRWYLQPAVADRDTRVKNDTALSTIWPGPGTCLAHKARVLMCCSECSRTSIIYVCSTHLMFHGAMSWWHTAASAHINCTPWPA